MPSISKARFRQSCCSRRGFEARRYDGEPGLSSLTRPPFHVRSRHMPDLDIITFGCRLNAYESEVMRAQADAAGLKEAVIVNTCAVTAEAVRQARQAIRKARRERPEAKIIVTGCAAQIDPSRFAAMAEVDHVIGNQEKLEAETFARFGADDC